METSAGQFVIATRLRDILCHVPLTREQQKKAADWLDAHFRGCPNCGSKGVHFGDPVALPITDSLEGEISDKVALALPVSCKKCGCLTFFNTRPFLAPGT